MKWEHWVDIDWLEARRHCLTATDVKELLPITKTGRKRTVTDEDYLAVMARKLTPITTENCYSTGAAARGHILEPYAIKAYNDTYGQLYYHWDDIVIKKNVLGDFGLGFSPDGLNVEMPKGSISLLPMHQFAAIFPGKVTSVAEIKCYEGKRHLISINSDQDKAEERWQIAVAMAVLPSIDNGTLIFYNPSLPIPYQLGCFFYVRDDLKDEIEMVLEVQKEWLLFAAKYDFSESDIYPFTSCDEADIISQLEKAGQLNP